MTALVTNLYPSNDIDCVCGQLETFIAVIAVYSPASVFTRGPRNVSTNNASYGQHSLNVAAVTLVESGIYERQDREAVVYVVRETDHRSYLESAVVSSEVENI